MQSTNIPSKIQIPFANSAGSSYKNTIPQASQIGITNGKASLTDGFPPLTFQAISSGGVPPFGADFNGILYEITAIQQWQEAGGLFTYDATFSSTIGGYPNGAVLLAAGLSGLWLNSVDNNTSNPDTGGAGWISLAFEGSQSVTVTTADVTLTTLQAAYPVLIISGALTANRNLIFPATVGEYIVQNNTTGSFTLTARTASGTGVTLTQGQSTFIYGDGANISFADSAKVASFNGRVGTVSLTSSDVISALGFTPYNAANPANYVSNTPGLVDWFASTTAPSGYLACNGAAISRTTYSGLFSAIGTTFGAGDGSTTFNIPDLRAVFVRGWDNGRGLDPSRVFGSYQADSFGSHTHTDTGHGHLDNIILGSSAGSGNGLCVAPQTSIESPSNRVQIQNGYAALTNTGGTETTPKNVALLACIKY